MQLLIDLKGAFGENFGMTLSSRSGFDESQIQKELFWCCDKLITKKTKSEILEEIMNNIYALANIYDLTLNDLENERMAVEQKEGNYLNGKFVND